MALIKCSECGKEISDKAKQCIHCGCPIENELICVECGKKVTKDDDVCKNCGCPIEKKKKVKKATNLFMKIWLIVCIILCLLVSGANLFDVLNVNVCVFQIGGLKVNVMGFLALMLAINYGVLLKTLKKKWFYLLLSINAIIFVYNMMSIQLLINLFYVVCVCFNVLITFLVVRKSLKGTKFSIKEYAPVLITFIVIVILTVLLNLGCNIRSNQRNSSIPQIEIITDYINIRYDKNVNSDIIGKVYYGEVYDIISEDKESIYNWYEIETSNGIRGFIAGKMDDDKYVNKLEVNGIQQIDNVFDEKEEENNTETIIEELENNNSTNNSNNNYYYEPIIDSTPAPVSYNITSISGIGGTYISKGYNECRVDSLTASVKEIYLENQLQVDYTITMTKTQRFYDDYDTFCYVKLSVYDSSNVVVGTQDAFVDIGLNETGR